MTRREQLQEKGINLNTLLIIIGLATGGITIGKFAGPIFGMPEKITSIEGDVSRMGEKFAKVETAQIVQAEALQRLTDLAVATASTKETQARQTEQLMEIRRRLDRLESR